MKDSTFFHAAFKDNTQFGSNTYFGVYGQANSVSGFGIFGVGGINGARGGAFWATQPGVNTNIGLWGLGVNTLGGNASYFGRPNIGLEVGSNDSSLSGLYGWAVRVDSGDVELGGNGGPLNTTYVNNLNISGSVSGAGAPWLLSGNNGTSSASNFLGTTDATDLALRTNNVEPNAC